MDKTNDIRCRKNTVDIFNSITNDEYLSTDIEELIYEKVVSDLPCQYKWGDDYSLNKYNNMVYKIATCISPESYINCDRVDDKYDALINVLEMSDIAKILDMECDDFNANINKQYKERVTIRGAQKISATTSEMFPCPNCKGRKTEYKDVQLRSDDEGSTMLLRCQICEYRWKINS